MDTSYIHYACLGKQHWRKGDRAALTCINDLNQAAVELGAVDFGGGADVLDRHLTAMPSQADF